MTLSLGSSYNVYSDYENQFMPKTSVVSSRLEPAQEQRLARMARQFGRTPSETGALLIEEGLRRAEFAFLDFRDSPVGRQAYVLGSRVAVWQVVQLVRGFADELGAAAAHLGWPEFKVQAAMTYARTYPEEIELALEDSEAQDATRLARLLPQLEPFLVP